MASKPFGPSGPRIWIAAEFARAYGQDLLDGVATYLDQHGPWEVYTDRNCTRASLRGIEGYPPLDGIITEGSRPQEELLEMVRRGIRVVCVEAVDVPVPQVVPSDLGIGRLAGEYLRDLSLPHYAFVGLPGLGVRFSDERLEAYREVLAASGIEPIIGPMDPYGRSASIDSLVAWVRGLPKPCGVFTINMLAALPMLRACRMAGVAVPEELAVLTVGDDEHFCRLANPPLSAIDHNTARVGYEAAALMDRLLAGEDSPAGPLWIQPRGVIERQSTNVLATRNAYVARAVEFIDAHAPEGITVEQVVQAACCPRRTLEQAFRRHLDRGIHAEILRRQIQRAKELLAQTHLPLADVAERAGFASAARLSQVFRRDVGMTPSGYRRKRAMPGGFGLQRSAAGS